MNRTRISLFLGALLLPGTALAMPSFPGQIQQHLGLSSAPGCILCHGSDVGGGPVSQPFGQAMLAHGLTSAGGDSLTSALDKMEADGTDSNGDGIADVTGLREGIPPTGAKPPVEYGCGGGRIAAPRGQLGWPASVLSILTFGILSSRALRRQPRVTLLRESTRSARV